MAYTPADSAIKLSQEQEAKISTMFTDELGEYLRGLACEQGLVRRDNDPQILIPIIQTPQQERLVKVLTLNGKSYQVTGANEAELVQGELDLLRSVMNGAPNADAEVGQVVARDERGRFVKVEVPSEDAEAERINREAEAKQLLMTGQIDATQYLKMVPETLDTYLAENYGIRREEVADKREIEDWTSSTKQFLEETEEGKHWPGGQANLEAAQAILAENPQLLENGGTKLDALVAIARHMRENDLFAKNPEIENLNDISGATDFESLRVAAARAAGIPANRQRNW